MFIFFGGFAQWLGGISTQLPSLNSWDAFFRCLLVGRLHVCFFEKKTCTLYGKKTVDVLMWWILNMKVFCSVSFMDSNICCWMFFGHYFEMFTPKLILPLHLHLCTDSLLVPHTVNIFIYTYIHPTQKNIYHIYVHTSYMYHKVIQKHIFSAWKNVGPVELDPPIPGKTVEVSIHFFKSALAV